MGGTPKAGDRLDRFLLVRCHASGSMGAVWRAEDLAHARPVALKLAPRGFAAGAAALKEVDHPHVVRVLEIGETAHHDFWVMDWVEGRPLPEWLKTLTGVRPRWPRVLGVLLEAGAGLAAAHRARAVHGDFKPSNVLVCSEGRARVIDFAGAPTHPGSTAGYLAPERLFGAPPDAASDQFEFCVTAYEALYGRAPFSCRERRLFGAPCPPPRGRAPDALYAPLRRGLEADPAARHPSMDALLEALEASRTLRR